MNMFDIPAKFRTCYCNTTIKTTKQIDLQWNKSHGIEIPTSLSGKVFVRWVRYVLPHVPFSWKCCHTRLSCLRGGTRCSCMPYNVFEHKIMDCYENKRYLPLSLSTTHTHRVENSWHTAAHAQCHRSYHRLQVPWSTDKSTNTEYTL